MRGAAAALALLALIPAAPAVAQPLDFERFFDGPLTGTGTVDNRREGTSRPFTAVLDGRWDGPRGTLAEVLTYADGEVRRFAWTFERTAPGRYRGHRDDLVGAAEAASDAEGLRLTYTARTPLPSGSVWSLSFDDRFRQTAPDTVTLSGTVTYLFVTVGATHMTIRRGR